MYCDPLVIVQTSAETIQGRKLFKDGNYSQNYGILFCWLWRCVVGTELVATRNLFVMNDMAFHIESVVGQGLRFILGNSWFVY